MQKSQTKAEVDGLLGSMSADGEHTLTENYGEALETLPIDETNGKYTNVYTIPCS